MNAAICSTIPVFESDRSAHTAHASLRRSLAIADQAQHCAVLWFGEILRRRLFRKLGYSSMNQYAERALGFSRSKTGDFLRLASKLEELPVLKESVATGRVPYTKAREVIKVATPKTERGWVDEAAKSSRRELADKVARVKRKAAVRRRNPGQGELLPAARIEKERVREVPVRLSVEMSAEQFARFEALWEKLQKLGGIPTGGKRADVLLEALAGRVEELERGTSNAATVCNTTDNAPRATRVAPPVTIHIHACPSCSQATVQTSQGEKDLTAAELERARCDATTVVPGMRARASIAPRIRRAVLQRDRHRCQSPGCTNTRFLEVHHMRPVSMGGGNDPDNLVTLCGACHRLVHESSSSSRSGFPKAPKSPPGDTDRSR